MAACEFAFVASGTATLELASFLKPMVVLYRLGWLSYRGFRLLCTSPFISLVNILAGEEVVPEDISWRDTSAEQARRASRLLEDTPERAICLAKLERLRRELLRPGASQRAAETLSNFLEAHRGGANAGAPPAGASLGDR
jgi:lipid-A-disaccharide synthase